MRDELTLILSVGECETCVLLGGPENRVVVLPQTRIVRELEFGAFA